MMKCLFTNVYCGCLTLFLVSCASAPVKSPLENIPQSIKIVGRKFTIYDNGKLECFSAEYGKDQEWGYAIFINDKFDRLVPFPTTHIKGRVVEEPILKRVSKVLQQPSIIRKTIGSKDINYSSLPYSKSLNVLPGFIPILPFVIKDNINASRMSRISIGDSLSTVPEKNNWHIEDGYVINRNMAVALSVSNGIIREIFENEFYLCQFNDPKP